MSTGKRHTRLEYTSQKKRKKSKLISGKKAKKAKITPKLLDDDEEEREEEPEKGQRQKDKDVEKEGEGEPYGKHPRANMTRSQNFHELMGKKVSKSGTFA